ncbi:hypothetical protein RAS1_36420 [Phycisphaerae bacterium RAS1]|nr:hypothetical protein RAS1_36420 [Phycisphaerae bacterium RAS1]
MKRRHSCLLLACVLSAAEAFAGGPLREAESDNQRFTLHISPGTRRGDNSGCSAKLLEGGRKRWERGLVNDTAPVAAAISDDGKFVVTLDEFRRGGARNPIVIYGERGQLLRHFVLSDILRRDEWKRVRKGKRSIDWLENAEYAFQEQPPEFQLDLSWGRTVRIDLKTLQIIREKGDEREYSAGAPPEFSAILDAAADGGAPPDLKPAAKLTPEQMAALIEQIRAEDPEFNAAGLSAEELLAAAAELDIEFADAALREGKPNVGDAKAAASPSPAAGAPAGETEPGLAWENGLDAAAADAIAAVTPPPPDPAAPVNYVQWANELGVVEGPDAKPFYDAAVAAFVQYEGNQELFDAAMKSDPAALASPEITNWLAANQNALGQWEAGAALDRKGWHFESGDGSLIGVLLPQLGSLRQIAKAAVIEAHALEQQGRFDDAIDTYVTALRAGAHSGQGPTLIENLVGVAVQNLATEQILDLASRPEADQIDFAVLSQKLEASFIATRPMAETVQFERAAFMDTIQRLYTVNPSTGQYTADMSKAREFMEFVNAGSDGSAIKQLGNLWTLANTSFEDHVAAGNEFYDALSGAMAKPYVEGRDDFAAIDQRLEGPRLNPLLRVLAPSLSRAAYLNARHDANTRASMLVTNILAYRQQHGRLPDSLDAFAGRRFVDDPVAGSRFVYHVTEDGRFTLYSMGKDGVDNGGVHDPKAETNDYLFWPRPTKK